MAQNCDIHESHSHKHGPGCGHTAIEHEGHTDYLHDGHMHSIHETHVDEHRLSVTKENPDKQDGEHRCEAHGKEHKHGPGCGHEPVPHGDHTDYLVEGHLHNQRGDRCESHGEVRTRAA